MVGKAAKIPPLKNFHSLSKEIIHIQKLKTLLQGNINTWKLIMEMYTDAKETIQCIVPSIVASQGRSIIKAGKR